MDLKHATEEQNCSLCELAKEIGDDANILCTKKGVVRKDHICRKFTLDLFKLKPTPGSIPCFDPSEDFRDII